jgi:ketosteroid isomerase-like protein
MTDAADAGEMDLQYRERPRDRATAERNREALLAAFDALKSGDDARFWGLFDPAVSFHEAACLPYGGTHEGLEATQRAFARMAATFSKMHSVFEQVLAEGDLVILYQTITFEVAANAQAGSIPVAELFRFREGRIIEWRALYFDADLVARAIRAG